MANDSDATQALASERREIRLLDLESESTCTLRHVSLDDNPDYYALSYYWGPLTSTKPLEVKQAATDPMQVVSIRRTLASFLKHLYRQHGSITVWLDVICINQRSFAEQSAQVAMMGDIYKQARGVYAWMGEWDPDVDYLFGYANACLWGRHANTYDLKRIDSAVELLSQRPYWTRVWTIQECILSANLTLMCGNRSVEWDTLSRTITQEPPIVDNCDTLPPTSGVSERQARSHLRNIGQSRASIMGDSPLLLDLVLRFGSSHCSDVRDGVYGFRGLAKDGSSLVVDHSNNLLELLVAVISFHNYGCFQHLPVQSESIQWWPAQGKWQPNLITDGQKLAALLKLKAEEVLAGGLSDSELDWLVIPVDCPAPSTRPRPSDTSSASSMKIVN